jgi:hypothetical protein
MFRRVPAALHAALAVALLLAGVAPFSDEAHAQGTSTRAHACQQGGYLLYMRTDQTPFRNTGECVKYANQGGPLVPLTHAQIAVVGSGPNWSFLNFVGSGFAPVSPFSITITSAPGQPAFSFPWSSPAFVTGPDGSLLLSGAFVPAQSGWCVGYRGTVILTANASYSQASTAPFVSPC